MIRAKRWRRRLTDPAVYLAAGALIHTAGALSPAARQRLARLVGALWWRTDRRQQRTVLENLAIAFPQMLAADRADLGRRSVCQALHSALDFAHLLHSPQAMLTKVLLDPVTTRMRDGGVGRPVMMVIPHLGSWELFGNALTLGGVRASAVAHELRNPYLEGLLRRARTAHGLQIIYSAGAARGIVRAVRQGHHIGLLMDQNTRLQEGGAYVEFFGLPVTVTRAPAVLARRLGMDLHVGACVRHEGGFQIVTESLPQPPEAYADDLTLLQAAMAANEALIRRFPDQYLWTYRRWRYIPSGLPVEQQRRYPFYARPE
jgi:lauroyl/myristoyl acyltransferase